MSHDHADPVEAILAAHPLVALPVCVGHHWTDERVRPRGRVVDTAEVGAGRDVREAGRLGVGVPEGRGQRERARGSAAVALRFDRTAQPLHVLHRLAVQPNSPSEAASPNDDRHVLADLDPGTGHLALKSAQRPVSSRPLGGRHEDQLTR